MESSYVQETWFYRDRRVFGIATAAHAHTFRLECKKITTQDVVCRAISSDGELARDIEI